MGMKVSSGPFFSTMKKKTETILIKEVSDFPVINLAIDTLNKGKQALVFVNTKRSSEKTAEDIAKKIKLAPNQSADLQKLAYDIETVLTQPTKQCQRLSSCIKKGVAFHHAGLTHKQKEIIEDNFRNGKIKIISCTPTLSFGLDLPAFRAIIKDLKRFSHRGMSYIPVLEYLQMAGRAGRPKYDSFGEAIAISNSEADKEKITEHYIHGYPESITSKLAVEPVLRTYVLSLIATGFVNSKSTILDFFEKTFWAFQFKDMDEIEKIVNKMLSLLEKWGFISSSEKTDDFTSADNLKDNKIQPTRLGKRVAELYIDPYTAHFFLKCIKKIKTQKVPAFAYLQSISHTLEMRPLLNIRAKELEEIEEKLTLYSSDLLENEPSVYEPEHDDFLRSIKTALFFNEWVDEKNEEYLLETYNIRPGETRSKLELANWLLYCLEELLKIQANKKTLNEIQKLRIRIKYGVREELIPLLRFKNIGRVRARRLFNNKIRNLKEVKDADLMKLSQILGKSVALDLKKQLGLDPDKIRVKENKRKGQISLGDY